MCKANGIDLSYESLSSHETRQMLRDLPNVDPAFFAEISQPRSRCAPNLSSDECIQEDTEELFEAPDDSDVPLGEVAAYIEDLASGVNLTLPPDDTTLDDYAYVPDEVGGLSCVTEAEGALKESIGSDEVTTDVTNTFSIRPKRSRRPNVLYSTELFESH